MANTIPKDGTLLLEDVVEGLIKRIEELERRPWYIPYCPPYYPNPLGGTWVTTTYTGGNN